MRATVSHFEIPARDPERAARFYRDVFGWRIEPLAWEGRPYYKVRGSAETGSGREGIDGGLMAVEENEGVDQPILVVHISGLPLETCLEKIVAAGGSIDRPAARIGEMGLFARFRDSEGNRLGLWQALPTLPEP